MTTILQHHFVTEDNRATGTLKDRQNAMTRQMIIESAVDELEHGSTEALTMRNIARRCNIAERTLFRHFASRDDLLDGFADLFNDGVKGQGLCPCGAQGIVQFFFRNFCKQRSEFRVGRGVFQSRQGFLNAGGERGSRTGVGHGPDALVIRFHSRPQGRGP